MESDQSPVVAPAVATFVKPTVISLICNFGLGGAQRFHAIQARALSEVFRVIEVVFDEQELPKIYDSGLEPVSLGGGFEATGLVGKVRRFGERVHNLRRLIQKERVSATISHMLGANSINACTLTGEQKVFLVQGSVLHDEDTWGRAFWLKTQLLMPFLYRRAHANVSVSQGIQHELKQLSIPRTHTITNCADLSAIGSLSQASVGELETVFQSFPTLVWSGRFCPQKKPEGMLRIFAQARQKHPNLKLILLGDGPDRAALMALSESLGLRPYPTEQNLLRADTFFLGTVANPFAYLKRATLYVLNSGWEGFPLALCEALACGCTSLCSDCPTGPREILAPSNLHFRYDLDRMEITPFGVLLPRPKHPEYENAWVQAIMTMLDDREARERISRAAVERSQDFDQSVICQQWVELLQRLISRSER